MVSKLLRTGGHLLELGGPVAGAGALGGPAAGTATALGGLMASRLLGKIMTSEIAANGLLNILKGAAPASSALGVTHVYNPDSDTLEPTKQVSER
jgi:hypothetical protein